MNLTKEQLEYVKLIAKRTGLEPTAVLSLIINTYAALTSLPPEDEQTMMEIFTRNYGEP